MPVNRHIICMDMFFSYLSGPDVCLGQTNAFCFGSKHVGQINGTEELGAADHMTRVLVMHEVNGALLLLH